MTEPTIKVTTMVFKDEKCYGPGIHALLLGVAKHHSLRGAAQSMGMAYSKAWRIIKSCEQGLGFALITSTIGGRQGGGATLTPEGERMTQAYAAFCREMDLRARELAPELFGDLLQHSPMPEPRSHRDAP